MSKTESISVVIEGRLFVGGLKLDGVWFRFASQKDLIALPSYPNNIVACPVTSTMAILRGYTFDPPHFIPTAIVDGIPRKVSYRISADGHREMFYIDPKTNLLREIHNPTGGTELVTYDPYPKAKDSANSIELPPSPEPFQLLKSCDTQLTGFSTDSSSAAHE